MQAMLMHKDDAVACVEIGGGRARQAGRPVSRELLPLPAQKDIGLLGRWLEDRAVPGSRHGVRAVLRKEGAADTRELMARNLGLGLTDCYWLRPRGSRLSWAEVNLFGNDFSDGRVGSARDMARRRYSPDSVLQGELKKKWLIREDGARILVKGFYGADCQQSLNEVLATMINRAQPAADYVEYEAFRYRMDGETEGICTACENIVRSDAEEMVSFWDIYEGTKKRGSVSPYWQTVRACAERGLDEGYVRDFLSYQILLDYLMSNPDRHLNNISVVRDSGTMRFTRMAPIYDCGNGMFWDRKDLDADEAAFRGVRTRSFLEKEESLLRYVTDFGLMDLSRLPSDGQVRSLYGQDPGIPGRRIGALLAALHFKAGRIERLQARQARERAAAREAARKAAAPGEAARLSVRTKNSAYELELAGPAGRRALEEGRFLSARRDGGEFLKAGKEPLRYWIGNAGLLLEMPDGGTWATTAVVRKELLRGAPEERRGGKEAPEEGSPGRGRGEER